MKYIPRLFIAILITGCSVNHPTTATYHLDENGEVLNSGEFQDKWRNKENNYSRWDYVTEDSSRVARLSGPLYRKLKLDYSAFSQKLENITNREFPEDQIFLLEYTFANDLCDNKSSNNWNKQKVRSRKRFTDANRKKVEEKDQLVVLNFFEEGILLENKVNSEEEYFFTDKENFLRNQLFTNPTLCGSFAVIKPNGEALIRNGEYSVLSMAEHLKEENWNLFFGRN